MYDISCVISFFLSKAPMSPKKLQKLLYYAYAWTLALLNESVDDLRFHLFSDRIEAWVHGPVISEVYGKYRDYGWQNIPQTESFDDSIFSEDVRDILNQVWSVYGGFSGNELEAISHKETPWISARHGIPAYEPSNNPILDKDMFIFYNEQANRQ